MKRALKKNNKFTIYKIIFLLICLILITLLFNKETFSKYYSKYKIIDKSKVANFIVEVSPSSNNILNLDCKGDIGYTVNYNFNIKNNNQNIVSEISTKYGIEIILPEALPNGITMKVDNTIISTSSNKLNYTISNLGTFKPGLVATKNHTLTFIANPEIVRYDKTISGIKINVIAEQID